MRLRVLANFAFDPQIFTAHRQADSDPFRRCAQDYDRGIASMPPHVISPCGLRDFTTWAARATSLRPCSGHEMLDDSGIIHMNGRLYDAELGRMLSADPYVQVPEHA